MTNNDLRATLPDLKKIQCTKCKYQAVIELKGQSIKMPELWTCKKYTKENPKPKGIVIRKYDISKHEIESEGHYIKCKFFESE